jgi:hypothetical protein
MFDLCIIYCSWYMLLYMYHSGFICIYIHAHIPLHDVLLYKDCSVLYMLFSHMYCWFTVCKYHLLVDMSSMTNQRHGNTNTFAPINEYWVPGIMYK